MSKTINATLLAHKGQASTTLTDLLLVGPLSDDTYRGFTLLDVDVVFTPSVAVGAVTFRAHTGVELSALEAANDMSVNNAEASSLEPVAGFEMQGFTQVEIDSGALDGVRFCVLRVNYNDLTTGRSEVIGGGTIGEVRRKLGGLTVLELRSWTQTLLQVSIIELDSLSCRAKFGSQALGTGGGVVEQRFPCGYDLTAEWVAGTITSVGGETDRQFIDSGIAAAGADYYAPGMVRFLTGDNAGQMVEVESYDTTSGVVELKFPTVSAMQAGDTFEIRRHCTKQWTGHNSCETFWAADKTLHYRGEPHIPVGSAQLLNAPGAAITRTSTNGTGE